MWTCDISVKENYNLEFKKLSICANRNENGYDMKIISQMTNEFE